MDVLFVDLLVRILLGNLVDHGRHERGDRVLALLLREETGLVGTEVVLFKVVLVIG